MLLEALPKPAADALRLQVIGSGELCCHPIASGGALRVITLIAPAAEGSRLGTADHWLDLPEKIKIFREERVADRRAGLRQTLGRTLNRLEHDGFRSFGEE